MVRFPTSLVQKIVKLSNLPFQARLVGKEQRQAEERLVYDCYQEAGYIHPNSMRRFPTKSPLYSIGLFKNQELIASISIVDGASAPLPIEQCLNSGSMRLRRKGTVEFTRFAIKSSIRGPSSVVVFHLLRQALTFTKDILERDNIVLAVHPRHARFYSVIFGCSSLNRRQINYGEIKAPAELMFVEIQTIRDYLLSIDSRLHDFFFAETAANARPGCLTRSALC